MRTFYAWCADQQLDPLTIRRVHLDAYTRHLESPQPATGRSAARSSIARALSALSGLYAYAVDEGILDSSPAARSKRRPKIVKNSQSTGLTRDEGRRLLAAAAADGFRSHALISLLINIGLRIDEALSRDVEHLGSARGHQVLMLHRKGGASDVAPLAPATAAALRRYLADRDRGPLFATRTGRRMDEPAAWRLVRRLGRNAGLPVAGLNPHALRHTFITAAFDTKAESRDVEDAAGHSDPRTTRHYDRSRYNLDRHVTYAVTAFFAGDEPAAPTDDDRDR